MQLDMHYYGTYAMARAAGLNEEACQIIAYASQYVDDNAFDDEVDFDDGARIDSESTAHHPVNLKNAGNLDPQDQRRVWVPFHFLPGNEGDKYTQRLKCTKNSQIAQEMVSNHLSHCTSEFGLHLAGITAHVYADTFSHYGFSGVSSRGNKVHQDSFELDENLEPEIKDYILSKAHGFFESRNELFPNIKKSLAELFEKSQANIAEFGGALGHGSVATYPDRPYLSWRFNYEDEKRTDSGWRHNQETFLDACKELHGFFSLIAKERPEYASSKSLSFSDIEPQVREILAVQKPKQGRIDAWQDAAGSGAFGENVEIPTYSSDVWSNEWEALKHPSTESDQANNTNIYKFYRAAAYHRVYVLRDLLPSHGLVVD